MEEKEEVNKFERVRNRNEAKSPKAEVRSFFDYTTPEMLKRRVVKEILAPENEIKRKARLERLGLSTEASERDMLAAIEWRIGEYRMRVAEAKKFIPEQLKRTNEWLGENQLQPKQYPENIPVYIADTLLVLGMPEGSINDARSQFRPKENDVIIDLEEGVHVLAHEYMHAMSRDKDGRVVGFRRVNERGEIDGNHWLDEGTAMIGEFAAQPTESQDIRDEGDKGYWYFYWLTQQFIQELGVTEVELLRAFFDQEDARKWLEEKTRERFNCSVGDLAGIPLVFDEEDRDKIARMLKGETVFFKIAGNEDTVERYKKLTKIFPNIVVSIRTDGDLAELIKRIKSK